MTDAHAPDPLAGWDGTICPPHELLPGTPPVIRELCKRANEWNAEGDFAGEVLALLAAYRAALTQEPTNAD